MRTQNQIVKRIEERKKGDPFAFETVCYVPFLDYEHVKPYVEDDVTAESWEPKANTRETILATMLDYMPFAWDKAKNCRGLSAGRSIAHYKAWVWLLDDGFEVNEDYQFYGKDELRRICKQYGWNPNQWDDGIRGNNEEECEKAAPIPELTD
jgi:hypothetical protein